LAPKPPERYSQSPARERQALEWRKITIDTPRGNIDGSARRTAPLPRFRPITRRAPQRQTRYIDSEMRYIDSEMPRFSGAEAAPVVKKPGFLGKSATPAADEMKNRAAISILMDIDHRAAVSAKGLDATKA